MKDKFIIISGKYLDPQGNPIKDANLRITSQENTYRTTRNITVSSITDIDGSYSFNLVPDIYNVDIVYSKGEREFLGVFQLFTDSIDGTLHEYLACFNPDQAQPSILDEMQDILEEAKSISENLHGMNWRGEYSPIVNYLQCDAVEYAGSSYICINDSLGNPPNSPKSKYWDLYSQKGDDGKSAYEIWLAEGNTGTEKEYLESLKGDPGPAGLPNEYGVTGNFSSSNNNNLSSPIAHGTFTGGEYWKMTYEMKKTAPLSNPQVRLMLTHGMPCDADGNMLQYTLHYEYKVSHSAPTSLVFILTIFGVATKFININTGIYTDVNEPYYSLTYWY